MKDTVKKMVKTGYGLGLLSLAEAKKMAAVAKKELKLDDKESLQLARELVKTSSKVGKEAIDVVSKGVEGALVKSGLAKKSELKVVKKVVKGRVRKLKSKAVGKVKKLKK